MSTSSSGSSQRSSGPYFLAIEGLPKKYTWQDLKDLIRKQAAHNCWTEMAVHPNGQSSGNGLVRVAREDEAAKLFRFLIENLVENRPLIVHLWNISSTPALFTHCNCGGSSGLHPRNDKSTRIFAMGVGPGWQSCMPTSPLANMARPYPIVPSQAPINAYSAPSMSPPMAQTMPGPMDTTRLAGAMNRMQLNSRGGSQPAQYQTYQARQAQQWQQQQQASQFPLYASNATGTPINISQGIVRTECRGIFVNGLNYRARREDIEKHFSKAGDIIRVDLQKDSTSGKSKGNCTIQYARAESAAEAIKIFHGREFMSMRLNVRKDKEATAINAPSAGNARSTHAGRANMEPIIVNGSQVRKDSVLSSS